MALDRSTSEAINCCGESLNGAPAKHEGIEYKFPFDAEKKTYQYFDTTLGKASAMEYKASEEVDGVNVYRYEQVIEPTKIAELEVPGTLIGRDRGLGAGRPVLLQPPTGLGRADHRRDRQGPGGAALHVCATTPARTS